MANYKLSKLAELDIDDITAFTAKRWGERQALAYPEQLRSGAQFVANFPTWGKTYTTKRGRVYQRYRIGKHMLFYRPVDDGIFVVRILHVSMDFDRHLD